MTDYNKLPLLLFDDQCTMCLRFKQGLKILDKNDEFNCLSIHDEQLYEKWPNLTEEECLQDVHLITPEKTILKGSEVIEYIAFSLPSIKKFSWLLNKEQTKKAIDLFYKRVNKHKHEVNHSRGCCH